MKGLVNIEAMSVQNRSLAFPQVFVSNASCGRFWMKQRHCQVLFSCRVPNCTARKSEFGLNLQHQEQYFQSLEHTGKIGKNLKHLADNMQTIIEVFRSKLFCRMW